MTEVISGTTPRARKRHRCDTCLSVILPGEKYHRAALCSGGRAWTWKEHVHCRRIMSRADWCSDEAYPQEVLGEADPFDIMEEVERSDPALAAEWAAVVGRSREVVEP